MSLASTNPGYKGGRIVRIFLENFMVYKKLDFFPSPGLNLILGVNGSGKSSIMCAICLCLGGKATDTGKKMRIADFINGRSKFANILIELNDPEKRENVSIHRRIESTGSSKFYINEREVKEEMVLKELKRFNIQVSNLCQFLPQEKVADFARMNQQQLLESMQQAVGDLEIHSNYKKLLELRKIASTKEVELNKGKEFINAEQQKNDSIKSEIEKIQKQDECKKKFELLKQQVPLCKYYEKCAGLTEQKNRLVSVTHSWDELHKKFSKHNNHFAKIGEEIKKQSIRLTQFRDQLKGKESEIEAASKSFKTTDDQIRDLKEELSSRITDVEEAKKREYLRERQIQSLIEELRGLEIRLAELKNTFEENKGSKIQKNKELINVQLNISSCNARIIEHKDKKEALRNELHFLLDMKRKKIYYIQTKAPDVYKAMQHLETCKNRFRKEVLGPLMLLINVKERQYVKCVENHISPRDMLIFLCQDETDALTFVKIFREELHLGVNSSVVPSTPLSAFKHSVPLETLRKKYSFSWYMKDVIEGPDEVLAFLCNTSYIHLAPLGNGVPENKLTLVNREALFKRYYNSNSGYNLTTSRYGNKDTSCTTFQLSEKGILQHGSTEREQSIESEMQELNAEIEAEENSCASEAQKEEAILQELEQFKNIEKEINNYWGCIQNARINLKLWKENQAASRNNKVDIDVLKKQAEQQIKQIETKKMDILMVLYRLLQDCYGLAKEKTCVSIRQACAVINKRRYNSIIDNFNKEIAELQGKLHLEQEKYKVLQSASTALLKEAIVAYGINPKLSKDERLKELRRVHLEKFGSGNQRTLGEIESEMTKISTALSCISVADSTILQEYNDRAAEISERQKTVDSIESELSALLAEIGIVKSLWLEPLQGLVSKISARFSSYFKSLNCAGEVEIVEGGNPNEFEKYGLAIRVKYRDNAPLKELSQSHHSGGERSVAVIIFILSLQELTEVPFRCVDEINQGMDAVFERKIFEFIEASAENCSQYFLLTPKLLPGLNYSNNIKIHIIHSGVGLYYSNWDWPAIFTQARTLRSAQQ